MKKPTHLIINNPYAIPPKHWQYASPRRQFDQVLARRPRAQSSIPASPLHAFRFARFLLIETGQVKHNPDRLPADFMFQLTAAQYAGVVANCDDL